MIEFDLYKSHEAKAARDGAARAAEIGHEFGDPNLGEEYRDPFFDITSSQPEILFSAGAKPAHGNERDGY